MKKSIQAIAQVLAAVFILQGLSACALFGSPNAESPAAVQSDEQLVGIDEPKASDVAPLVSEGPIVTEAPHPIPINVPAKVETKVETKVEAKVEAPPPAKPEKKKAVAKAAAVKPVENGAFKTTLKACMMKSKPSNKSSTLANIPKGRKIWVQKSGAFYKVSRVKGVGYLAISCF